MRGPVDWELNLDRIDCTKFRSEDSYVQSIHLFISDFFNSVFIPVLRYLNTHWVFEYLNPPKRVGFAAKLI